MFRLNLIDLNVPLPIVAVVHFYILNLICKISVLGTKYYVPKFPGWHDYPDFIN